MRRLYPLSLGLLAALAAGCKDSPSEPGAPNREYRVGEIYEFNVQSQGHACNNPDFRDGRVVAITQRAIVVADSDNPSGPGTFTDQDYRAFGTSFDERVWPVITQNFGEPHDLDRNGRVIIFFTRAVNELTPRGQSWYVGGFFHPRDLFPQQANAMFEACQGSNEAEMMYMLVPDPTGEVNGNVRRMDRELASTVNVIAHELQHLVNASRRLYVVRVGGQNWSEEVWLNEGLSHIAEELMAYAISPMAPRQNVDASRLNVSGPERTAFGQHQLSNFSRLELYLSNPGGTSLIGPDSLSTRGATWQFLRYAADRRGGSEAELWRRLVDSNVRGLENLRSGLGTEPMPWINDWSIAIYTDDAVPSVAPEFSQPSWNFRSIFSTLISSGTTPVWGRFPLEIRPLAAGPTTAAIPGGGAVYFRFGVPSDGRGEIRVGDSSGTCQTVSLSVGQVHRVSGDQMGSLCFDGGGAGTEYTLIPFFASTVGTERLSLSVTAAGTVAPLASASTDLLSLARTPREVSSEVHEMQMAQQWEVQFRERTARELSRLVPGAAVHSYGGSVGLASVQTSAANDPRLRISIIRTR